uniref:Uncharacterized protein n=1 Tax=Rhizophora mucronata TaxID=61149 RepID=A0A2P2QFI5_RHIMU
MYNSKYSNNMPMKNNTDLAKQPNQGMFTNSLPIYQIKRSVHQRA